MPVFFNRDSRRDADALDVMELQDRIEELQSTLKKYRRFHTADLREYLDDVESQLLHDPSVLELKVLNEKIELIEERLEDIEDIEDMYDIEDYDDHSSIREEFEDLLEDLDDLDF